MKTGTRPLYRPFNATVAAVVRLTESFVRVTFSSDDLRNFAPEGLDQRIKLVLPNSFGEHPELTGDDGWYAAWCALGDAQRPPMRTYTVRRWHRSDDGAMTIDVDFVLHGPAADSSISSSAEGPAARWARLASLGDRVQIIGPDAASGGPWGSVAWNPPASASQFVLAGDETAAPAIASILESLPAGTAARAFIEVPTADDVLAIALPTGVELTWLSRDGAARGSLLSAAVLAAIPIPTLATDAAEPSEDDELWDVPGLDPVTGTSAAAAASGDLYAWLAGESSVIKALRRHLVRGVGIDRASIAFMGYWRDGAAEN